MCLVAIFVNNTINSGWTFVKIRIGLIMHPCRAFQASLMARRGLKGRFLPNRVLVSGARLFNQNLSEVLNQDETQGDNGKSRSRDSETNFKSTILKMLESAAATFASITVLGYGTHQFLGHHCKISNFLQYRGLFVP